MNSKTGSVAMHTAKCVELSGAIPQKRHVGSSANLFAVDILLYRMCLKCMYESLGLPHASLVSPPNQGLPMGAGLPPPWWQLLPSVHPSLTQQSILGAFAPSNQQPTPAQKLYAEAAKKGPMGKDPVRAASPEATSPSTTAAIAQAGRHLWRASRLGPSQVERYPVGPLSKRKEVATYIVFRIVFDPVKAYKTKTRHLANSLEREGFHVLLRGNQQRAKTSIEGITKVESGKRPIWHFYVYTDTSALGHRFPRNFHVTLDDGENFNLDYAVRSSVECVTPEGELAIHGAAAPCRRFMQHAEVRIFPVGKFFISISGRSSRPSRPMHHTSHVTDPQPQPHTHPPHQLHKPQGFFYAPKTRPERAQLRPATGGATRLF